MLEGSLRECSAGFWLETRGTPDCQIKVGHLSSRDVSSVARGLHQTAPFCPSTTLSHQTPESVCKSACSTWLPPRLCWEKTPFTPILLQTSTLITTHFVITKGAISLPHLEAVSARVRAVFLCSFAVYQVPTVGAPLCLGVGDRPTGRLDHSPIAGSLRSRALPL